MNRCLGLLLVFLTLLASPVFAAPSGGRVQVGAGILSVVARSSLVGPANASQNLLLGIALRPRHLPEMQAYADAVSNPLSPSYRQFLTPEQVGEAFGASASEVDAVAGYLRSQGMTVTLTDKDHIEILAKGSVAQVEASFATKLNIYRSADDGGHPITYMANATAPSLPANLAAIVVNVAGLETFTQGKASGSILTPLWARTLYNSQPAFNAGWHGEGRKIAITNFDGYRLGNAIDYIALYGLPVPTGGTGSNIHIISISGNDGQVQAPSGEGDLDIQMELASAPLADVYIYDSANNIAGYTVLLTQEANDNLADIISDSWSWDLDAVTATSLHNLHLAMTLHGQTYLVASGDHGTAFGGYHSGPSGYYSYPIYDPEITAVGGTSATTDLFGNRSAEDGWNGGGGGWVDTVTVPFNSLPSWQHGNGVPTGVNHRLVPDISLHSSGTAATGGAPAYNIFYRFAQAGFWGTSCAAPLCAGCLATVEQQLLSNGIPGRLGRLNDMIYQENGRADVWLDVTSGSNGTLPDGTASQAGVGWDFVTGWGAPNFEAWYNVLSSKPVSGTVTLGSYSASPAGTEVTVELYLAGSTTLVDTQTGTLDDTGSFRVSTGAPVGNYDVYVKASHWLRRKSASQSLGASGLAGLAFALINGDINGDNVVSLADFAAMRAAFGSSRGSGNWNSNADLNGDGSVSLADFGILRANFGRQGE